MNASPGSVPPSPICSTGRRACWRLSASPGPCRAGLNQLSPPHHRRGPTAPASAGLHPSHTGGPLAKWGTGGPSYAVTGAGPGSCAIWVRLRPLIEGVSDPGAGPAGGPLPRRPFGSVHRRRIAARSGVIAIDASLWFDYPHQLQAHRVRVDRAAQTRLLAVRGGSQQPLHPGFPGARRFTGIACSSCAAGSGHPAQTCTSPAAASREDHHSVYHPPSIRGLQWLFQGYRMDLAPRHFSRQG